MKHYAAALLALLLTAPVSASSSVAATAPVIAAKPGAAQMISHGNFEGVAIYAPREPLRSVVLLFSDAAWGAQDTALAQRFSERGALVAGIDTARLRAKLEALPDACLYSSGDVENLSRFVQAYAKVPGYFPPMLVGQGRGAALVYALNAQAEAGKWAGALSLDFCPQTGMRKPFCAGQGLRYVRGQPGLLRPAEQLSAPWNWIDGGDAAGSCAVARIDAKFPDMPQARRYVTAAAHRDDLLMQRYDALVASQKPLAAALPNALADLPLIEMAVAEQGPAFALLLSGDGGWAGLDKDVAAALKAHGIPVVGLDSLRYFWNEKTPASLAQDIDRIIRYYVQHWQRERVLLIGYSQGANVLPFAMNRLPAPTRAQVAVTAMLGLSERADFEFHVSNWLGSSDDGLPIQPEVEKMQAGNPLCVYGAQETDSLCPALDAKKIRLVKLPGGHHFDGDYDHLARLILDTAGIKAAK